MVAVIKTGHSIDRILNYNENKVKEGVAEIIGAWNYPIDAEKLSFTNKLNRFKKQLELNSYVTRNSVHVSLNFDPSETTIRNETLGSIANDYMERIGFGEQPFLVYKHLDAGHPHIHIVTIKVRSDGSRIDMHNIGRNQSETARKEIEDLYGLKKAEGSYGAIKPKLRPVDIQKILYGRTDTKRAISNVLDVVLDGYRYTSLPELNAVLNRYNVSADRGKEDSRIFQNKGLVYRVLDEHGNKVGVPIKASDIHSKPILKVLEQKFIMNETARLAYKSKLKNTIDIALSKASENGFKGFKDVLSKQGVELIERKNEQGLVYGLTYIDDRTKCVFNGSALGKVYSAKAVLEKCEQTLQDRNSDPSKEARPIPSITDKHFKNADDIPHKASSSDILETLLDPVHTSGNIPYEFSGKKRKKKRSKHI